MSWDPYLTSIKSSLVEIIMLTGLNKITWEGGLLYLGIKYM